MPNANYRRPATMIIVVILSGAIMAAFMIGVIALIAHVM